MDGITAADLLVGSDEDFINNLYLAVLGRWPDPSGFAHLMAKIAGSQEARIQAITDVATSDEGMSRGRRLPVSDPLLPSEPTTALRRELALRTDFLRGLIEARRPATPSETEAVEPVLAEMRADVAALRREIGERLVERDAQRTEIREIRSDMAALRREMRERLAGSGVIASAPEAAPDITEYVNDLLAVAEARMELRLRAHEKHLH